MTLPAASVALMSEGGCRACSRSIAIKTAITVSPYLYAGRVMTKLSTVPCAYDPGLIARLLGETLEAAHAYDVSYCVYYI